MRFGGFDEAGGDGAGAATFIAAGEEPVFASDGDFAEGSFGGVVVDGEAAVGEVAGKDVPALEEVTDGAGGWGFGGQCVELLIEPDFELIDEGFGEFLSLLGALFCREVFELALEFEELADTFEGFMGDDANSLAISGGGDIEEFSTGMGPAPDFEDIWAAEEEGIIVAGGIRLEIAAVPRLKEAADMLSFFIEGEIVKDEVGGGCDIGPGASVDEAADGLI